MLTFGSLFTGIGGFDLGFERAGMKCKWQCEIDKDCHTVLKKHWREIPLYDDVRKISADTDPVDLICGGFPCQDISIAGRRKGLAGERSGLWWEFARIIEALQPRWVVAENVPGLLSSNHGKDLLAILDYLAELGYGVAWRILDAQYFGVPQRRKRIFIVASAGNGHSGQVLFDRTGSFRDSAKGKGEGKESSRAVANCLTTREGQRQDETIETLIPVYSFTERCGKDGGGKGILMTKNQTGTLATKFQPNIVWDFHAQDGECRVQEDTLPTLTARYGTGGNNIPYVGVRRLAPVECSRLQGFPDDWNEELSDHKRYKQFGNAVCVPVAEWIGKRIIEYDKP